MKRRDLVLKLESAGYRAVREGDHTIFAKEGCRSVQVPRHREVSENTARQILKIAGLT